MEVKGKGGTGTFKPVGWKRREVRAYKRACKEFVKSERLKGLDRVIEREKIAFIGGI